jgi:hypothetical protein
MLWVVGLKPYRAIFHAGPATGAAVGDDATGSLAHLDAEISRSTLDTLKIRIRNQFDVHVPADLDQLGRDDSHRAVVGGKGLVQLGHDPADGGGLFEQIDIVAGVGQIQRRLHAGDSAAYHQNGPDDIGHGAVLLGKRINPCDLVNKGLKSAIKGTFKGLVSGLSTKEMLVKQAILNQIRYKK